VESFVVKCTVRTNTALYQVVMVHTWGPVSGPPLAVVSSSL
jgi:hypothetical protein